MSLISAIGATQDFAANHVQVEDLAEQFSNIGLQSQEQNLVYQEQPNYNYGMVNQEEDGWNSLQRELIAVLVYKPNMFILSALDERLTYQIQRLIKQAKKTSALAQAITSTLSTKFYQIMTHRIGKHVVKQCLTSIDSVHNEVLFKRAIQYYLDLATHPEGCISLNECINYITGSSRQKLLLLIAEKSVYLSHDPHGNFVVQHVLSINNEYVNEILCNNLRGQYVKLSLSERGSHVVEKCIRCSIHGMYWVVEELLKKDKLLCKVSCNRYGNYVVQAALKASRVCDFEVYRVLVLELVRNLENIIRGKFSKKVAHIVMEEYRRMVESGLIM